MHSVSARQSTATFVAHLRGAQHPSGYWSSTRELYLCESEVVESTFRTATGDHLDDKALARGLKELAATD